MQKYINTRSVFMTCAILGLAGVGLSQSSGAGDWTIAGQNLDNSRSQPNEHTITAANVNTLAMKWVFTTGADVSATPTVADGAIYFPDWSGNLYAIKASDGSMLWSHQIADYDRSPGAVARVSPAVHGQDIIIGDIEGAGKPHDGANVMAVDRATGALRWITKVDSHPAAIITGSPVVLNDIVYVGVSSSEEGLAVDPTYPCCSFRGSMVAIQANNGHILWQTFTMPDNFGQTDGYSGGAIWQPPAIDPTRGLLFSGTGNNYEVPASVKQCLQDMALQFSNQQSTCFTDDDHFDSVMALDLQSGAIKWSKRLQGEDVWTVACLQDPSPVSCPEPGNPDYDFSGSGPNLIGDIVGFGQKSGMYWAFNPDDGTLLWNTLVGPGATLGGIEWGTATDGQRIYAAITNANHRRYPLKDGSVTYGGAWSALDVKTGKVIWQTADPAAATDMGAVSVANGVLFVPSFSGNMHALDASSGKILWTFPSGGSVIDGPSIVNGTVYWGSGYKKSKPGTPNNKVFAFTLGGS